MESSQLQKNAPRLVFMTGGPGSGKGTQCDILTREYPYKHISIGDLMRNEIKQGTEEGKAVQAIVQKGNLVPKEMTVALLLKTLKTLKAPTILVDGFPRSLDQAVYLEQAAGKLEYIVLFDTEREDILVDRLIERGKTSGRADDNEETIRYRFAVYKSQSVPVVSLYDPFNIIRRVDCLAPIKDVYKRTLKALRPELMFIFGPRYSGKSTLCSSLTERYALHHMTLESIITKKTRRSTQVLTDDYEIVDAVCKALLSLRTQYRVILEDFPQNLRQARRFAVLLGQPNRVIYLKCAKHLAQTRLLEYGSSQNDQSSPAEFNNNFEEFSVKAKEIAHYYRENIGELFGEVESTEGPFEKTFEATAKVVEPEVVMVRGELRWDFLRYLEKRGYKLMDAVMLVKLWREARGLNSSEWEGEHCDDCELITIFRDSIFSGAGTSKFAIFNFVSRNEDLVDQFQKRVCEISKVYYLSSELGKEGDAVSFEFFKQNKLEYIDTSKLSDSKELTFEDEKRISKLLEESEKRDKAWGILILGSSMTGKTTLATHLSSTYTIVDYEKIVEETKEELSTEDEPKESLVYSEFLEGLQRYLEKNPDTVFVFDSYPSKEIVLTPSDPKYPDFQVPENEDEYSIHLVAEELANRYKDFLDCIRPLVVVNLEAPLSQLQKRLSDKLEVGEDEELPPEENKELVESYRVYEFINSEHEELQNKVPRSLCINVSEMSEQDLNQRVSSALQKRIVLLRGEKELQNNLMSLFYFKHQLFWVDFDQVVAEALEQNESLAFTVRSKGLDPKTKVSLLKKTIQKRPLRELVVFVSGFFSEKVGDYSSGFQELELLEASIAPVQAVLSVGAQEALEIEPIPVKQRPVKKTEEEEDQDEEEPKEETPQEEEEERPMWNSYQVCSFLKTFHNFKFPKSEVVNVAFEGENFSSVLLEHLERILSCPESRFTLQVQADESAVSKIKEEVLNWDYSVSKQLNQNLPVDTSELALLQTQLSKALTNGEAKRFHSEYLEGYTAPFSTFWDHFSEELRRQGWEVTKGLRSAVLAQIDSNKNSFVDVQEINNFFQEWKKEEFKNQIKEKAQKKNNEDKWFLVDHSLVLLVQNNHPDPSTGAKSFNRGDTFEIEVEGFKQSQRFCSDSRVYFGRQNKTYSPDVEFNSAETKIQTSHFCIQTRKNGYYLTDSGSKFGVKVKVQDQPFLMYPDQVYCIGEEEFRVKACSSAKGRKDDTIAALTYKNMEEGVSGETDLVLEFVSPGLEGLSFSGSDDKKKLLIGSDRSLVDIWIPSAQSLHAVIELKGMGWCITDMHSVSGTWVYVNWWNKMTQGNPSLPLKLFDGAVFSVPNTEFKVIFKEDSKVDTEVHPVPGVRNGGFRSLYRLGKCIRSTVAFRDYECSQKFTRERNTVTVVNKESLTPEARETIYKSMTLDHPNLQRVLEVFEEKNNLYVVTESPQGGDLNDLISSRAAFSEEQTRFLMYQVFSALECLHKNSIVHSNVNPFYVGLVNDKENSPVKLGGFVPALFEKLDKHNVGFASPEKLKEQVSSKSDIWSCGVIMHIILSGTVPFGGEDIKQAIAETNLEFKEGPWESISSHAKYILQLLLTKDQNSRPSASALLKQPWVNSKLKYTELTSPMSAQAFKNLKSFTVKSKLHLETKHFVSCILASEEDKALAESLFAQADTDGSGKLSRNEIHKVFEEINSGLSQGEVETIIKELDPEMNGEVDYNSFLGAVSIKRKSLTKDKIQEVFDKYDKDASGEITVDEFKELIGGNESEIKTIIDQVDANSNGKIDVKEFKYLLINHL